MTNTDVGTIVVHTLRDTDQSVVQGHASVGDKVPMLIIQSESDFYAGRVFLVNGVDEFVRVEKDPEPDSEPETPPQEPSETQSSNTPTFSGSEPPVTPTNGGSVTA